MRNFVVRTVINALALWVVSAIFPNLIYFQQGGALDYLLAGLVLGLVNAVLRPILLIFTLPINVLTLGLFTLVINAIVLQLVAAWTRLETGGFLEAIIASLLLSLTSTVISSILGEERNKRVRA
ncbi:MAG: phage holin family protein [Pleurocapsa sp. SU_196_0]|nr:phage holin family protein [Pleurocapsa sp. SU_196_0]